MSAQLQYRISWEMPANVWLVDQKTHDKEVCQTYDWEALGEWRRTEVVFTGIRNFTLEKRVVALDEGVWQKVAS